MKGILAWIQSHGRKGDIWGVGGGAVHHSIFRPFVVVADGLSARHASVRLFVLHGPLHLTSLVGHRLFSLLTIHWPFIYIIIWFTWTPQSSQRTHPHECNYQNIIRVTFGSNQLISILNSIVLFTKFVPLNLAAYEITNNFSFGKDKIKQQYWCAT